MSAPKVDKTRSKQSEAYADAVAHERTSMFPTSTPEEREAARAFRPCVYPMPACTGCGQFRFPVPTLCYWCRRKNEPTTDAVDAALEHPVRVDVDTIRAQLAACKKPRKRSPRRP